ncbi:MAG: hypothetical protein KDD70_09145 [Bdellovibrionales bacterium]|nr:hypothetical protein [Bdellovibrionales bacterium]
MGGPQVSDQAPDPGDKERAEVFGYYLRRLKDVTEISDCAPLLNPIDDFWGHCSKNDRNEIADTLVALVDAQPDGEFRGYLLNFLAKRFPHNEQLALCVFDNVDRHPEILITAIRSCSFPELLDMREFCSATSEEEAMNGVETLVSAIVRCANAGALSDRRAVVAARELFDGLHTAEEKCPHLGEEITAQRNAAVRMFQKFPILLQRFLELENEEVSASMMSPDQFGARKLGLDFNSWRSILGTEFSEKSESEKRLVRLATYTFARRQRLEEATEQEMLSITEGVLAKLLKGAPTICQDTTSRFISWLESSGCICSHDQMLEAVLPDRNSLVLVTAWPPDFSSYKSAIRLFADSSYPVSLVVDKYHSERTIDLQDEGFSLHAEDILADAELEIDSIVSRLKNVFEKNGMLVIADSSAYRGAPNFVMEQLLRELTSPRISYIEYIRDINDLLSLERAGIDMSRVSSAISPKGDIAISLSNIPDEFVPVLAASHSSLPDWIVIGKSKGNGDEVNVPNPSISESPRFTPDLVTS